MKFLHARMKRNIAVINDPTPTGAINDPTPTLPLKGRETGCQAHGVWFYIRLVLAGFTKCFNATTPSILTTNAPLPCKGRAGEGSCQTGAGAINDPTPTGAINDPTPTGAINNPTPTGAINNPTPTRGINDPTPTLPLKGRETGCQADGIWFYISLVLAGFTKCFNTTTPSILTTNASLPCKGRAGEGSCLIREKLVIVLISNLRS